VLVDHKVKSIHFDLPEGFTREKYVQVIRKVLACVRFKIYKKVQKLLKKEGKDKLTSEEMETLLAHINDKHQEEYRIKSLAKYEISVPENEMAKRLMQKAYLVFSTISSLNVPKKEDENKSSSEVPSLGSKADSFYRSRWED
jgi:hypothetical protein